MPARSRVVVVDHHDSYTWNLVHLVASVTGELPDVVLHDRVRREDLGTATHLVLSPGPGHPGNRADFALGREVFELGLPVLGVCLGHQCIGFTAGAVVERAAKLMHGKTDQIRHDGRTLYEGMPNPFTATRYHSLIIRPGTLPPEYEISSWTDADEIMGVRHRTWPLEGVQFHPESFLTEQGERLLANFLKK